jgi:hypothetical protein
MRGEGNDSQRLQSSTQCQSDTLSNYCKLNLLPVFQLLIISEIFLKTNRIFLETNKIFLKKKSPSTGLQRLVQRRLWQDPEGNTRNTKPRR